MKSVKFVLLSGVFIWLITFLVSVVIFPLRHTDRPLFESIMPVVLTLSVMLFAFVYFKRVESDFAREGILVGIVWFLVSFAIDQLMFNFGPMKMAFIDYIKDIGLTYLIIPIITAGSRFVVQSKTGDPVV